MSRTSVTLLLAVVVAACMLLFLRACGEPPGDEVLIQRFHDKQPSYERLRDLFLADRQILLIADWGIETPGSPGSLKPPVAELSQARYDEYLALLKDIGGQVVSRAQDGPSETCIYVWASGFAGETRHEAVCWRDQPPPDQVAGLREIEQRSAVAGGDRTFVYRHVESQWYLMRDE